MNSEGAREHKEKGKKNYTYVRRDDNDNLLFLQKGKRGFWKIVFGRTMLMAIFCLAQIFAFFLLSVIVTGHLPVYTVLVVHVFLGLILALIIINKKGNPSIKISWLVLILLFPVFGMLMYIFTRMQIGNRIINSQLQQIIERTRPYIRQNEAENNRLRNIDNDAGSLSDYLMMKGGFPTYSKNSVEYFPLGEDYFESMVSELKTAKKFIFMEYFIVEEGYMWGTILNILAEKVKEGVEVRFMYDGMNAMARVPYGYYKKVRELGIDCKMFSPIHPIISTHYTNRDHRKICVIDGRTAFTGGINLSDEYINRRHPFGHWKDTGVMVKGSAVRSFTMMFLQLWEINSEKKDVYDKYLGPGEYSDAERAAMEAESGFVIPYSDIPIDGENIAQNVYLDMINNARHYVHIMTPYLVLDYETLAAIKFAAARGVEVSLLLPHIPDKKYAFALAKSHYKELIEAGVNIYEYTPGFVHAKTVISDSRKAVVGSVNLDYRSFYLHYECGVYMYQVKPIARIEDDFQRCLRVSRLQTLEDVKKRPLHMKLSGYCMKVMAPLI
ncbi:MAG: cardiolipin synthase [Anaerovoracaceae bacterium]|nr:cardiolipin synthase [Anaerovoracaceae bacterium]